MALNKRVKKKPVGKMSNQKEYPKLTIEQAMFNYLEREDLIEVNPITNVRLLKQDIDFTNCVTYLCCIDV